MPETDPGVAVRLEGRPEGRIGHVMLRDPARLNVLGTRMMAAFTDALAGLAEDPELRAVVLTGAGERAFVGGADIAEMATLDAAGARAFITRLHGCCQAVRDLPVPVIARINGYALGGGLELAAACDLRVAADTARFGMPEVKIGIPSVIEAALLPGLVGWGRTREMLLLGETFTAAEAAAWGLVERVVPSAELDAAVEGWLASLLAAGPAAIRQQKAMIRAWERLPLAAAIKAGIDSFAAAWRTGEPVARMHAHLRRRRP